MEKQSPTPPLSGPGSSVLTACDQELTSPADFSPLWTTSNGRAFETEHSHRFAADLQRALHNVDSYPRPLEEDLQQYIAVHETQPSYYEISPPQFFQYPPYQQEPSYMDYQSHPFSSLSPALTTMSESPAMNQLYRTYVWPAPQELRGPSDERRGDTYFAMSPEEEEDDDLCDKPYARLIYDALMQAPGHRMMLRDIYDWFQRHTTKPAESGTNGWQNSIRHNLSMNQAFENDKSDPANASGQKPKVNSVWVLTENAIRNGVQSTTRYRKTGSGKRMNTNRIPAPVRQRSGAKGGKAARRAAQLRKKKHLMHHGRHTPSPLGLPLASLYGYEDNNYDGADSSDAFSALDPTTPMPDLSFGGDLAFQTPRSASGAIRSPTCNIVAFPCICDADHNMYDHGYPPVSDLTLEDMLRTHQDSTVSKLST